LSVVFGQDKMLGRACAVQVARRCCVSARGGSVPLVAQARARGLPSARALLAAHREQATRAMSAAAAAAAPGAPGAKKLEGRCE
jgi:hypothetical protein